MGTFEAELKKTLHRNLPQSQENVWSKRVEGALIRSEEIIPHEYVTIIVDSSITRDEYSVLADSIYNVIKHDEYYRRSKYRIICWNDNEFKLVSKPKIQVGHVKECLDEISLGEGDNNAWNHFWELYKPHKKAGRVIMMTTSKMIESLKETKTTGIRNLVITFCGSADNKRKEIISNIPCVSYIPRNDKHMDTQ